MQVVILAGGLGTRLQPMTHRVPKVLVPVCGKPFLVYQFEWLTRHGLRDVVLSVGYRGDQIEAFVKDGRDFGVRVRYSRETEHLLGTAGALKLTEGMLDEEFCVLNGDSYLPVNPQDPIQYFREGRWPALLLAYRNRGRYDCSNTMVRNGRVTAYSRAPGSRGLEFIDYGLRIFKKEVLAAIPSGTFCDMDVLYQRLIADGQLGAYLVNTPFFEIGSVGGLARFSRHLERAQRRGA